MDAIVGYVGDSLSASSVHWGYPALGVPQSFITPVNKFYSGNVLYGLTSAIRDEWRRYYTSADGTTIATNYAVSGTNLDQFIALTAWKDNLNALAAPGPVPRYKLLVVAFGTNIGSSSTPSTFISTMEGFITSQKAAGWDDIVIVDIPSRTDASWGVTGAQNTAYAAPINAILRDSSWQTANNVTVADIAAETTIGPWDLINNVVALPSNDLTWFYDKVHPTPANVAIGAPIINAAINARLTANGCTTIPYTF
jgi:hypothetical protein